MSYHSSFFTLIFKTVQITVLITKKRHRLTPLMNIQDMPLCTPHLDRIKAYCTKTSHPIRTLLLNLKGLKGLKKGKGPALRKKVWGPSFFKGNIWRIFRRKPSSPLGETKDVDRKSNLFQNVRDLFAFFESAILKSVLRFFVMGLFWAHVINLLNVTTHILTWKTIKK